MAITNPRVIRYSNEVIRSVSESLRALKARIDSALITWENEIVSYCPDDSDEILEDGRSNNGVSILNGQDITRIKTIMVYLQTQMDQPNVSAWISKPCVRPLNVQE